MAAEYAIIIKLLVNTTDIYKGIQLAEESTPTNTTGSSYKYLGLAARHNIPLWPTYNIEHMYFVDTDKNAYMIHTEMLDPPKSSKFCVLRKFRTTVLFGCIIYFGCIISR